MLDDTAIGIQTTHDTFKEVLTKYEQRFRGLSSEEKTAVRMHQLTAAVLTLAHEVAKLNEGRG